jgi:uncharacterized protein YbaP (TraB family)
LILKSLGRRLAASAVALSLAGCLLTPGARAEPAMWVVQDADSTIYLFGTIHMLKNSAAWRTPKVEQALNASQEVWFELEEAGDEAAAATLAATLLPRLGLDPARPLSTKLTAEDNKRLAAAAAKLKLTPAQLEPMRPWLAALTLSIAPLVEAGYDPKLGVDPLLAAAARAQGKPIRALETMERQFRVFADLPLAVEVQMLRELLDDTARPAAVVDQLAAAWAAGDVARIETLMVAELEDSPELKKVLLDDRNRAWAEAIRKRLDGQGVSFVAVGAAHLAGQGSVQEHLAKLGFQAERR